MTIDELIATLTKFKEQEGVTGNTEVVFRDWNEPAGRPESWMIIYEAKAVNAFDLKELSIGLE